MPTEKMRADILAETVTVAKHKTFIEMLGMAKINYYKQNVLTSIGSVVSENE